MRQTNSVIFIPYHLNEEFCHGSRQSTSVFSKQNKTDIKTKQNSKQNKTKQNSKQNKPNSKQNKTKLKIGSIIYYHD
jgi:hypothetical protein